MDRLKSDPLVVRYKIAMNATVRTEVPTPETNIKLMLLAGFSRLIDEVSNSVFSDMICTGLSGL